MFREADNQGKVWLLKELREISNSVSISLTDPIEKTSICKWSYQKIDKSARCNPSTFELVLSKSDSCSLLANLVVPKKVLLVSYHQEGH